MVGLFLGISLVLFLDFFATVVVIFAARRNKNLRKRLIDSLRVLTGDAYLSVTPAAFTASNEEYYDSDGPNYEDEDPEPKDGFRPEGGEDEDADYFNH